MNVVKFFRNQTRLWNSENKCGFCWSFGAPLNTSGANKQKVGQDDPACCIMVLITDYRIRQQRTINPQTGLLSNLQQDHIATVEFLLPSDIGQNTYNETPGHALSESKWNEILFPLQECITPESVLEFCKLLKTTIQITTWDALVRNNYLSANYTGWAVTMTLRDGGDIYPIVDVTPVTIEGTEDWSGVLEFDDGSDIYQVTITNGSGVLMNATPGQSYDVGIDSGPGAIQDAQPMTLPDEGITINIQ